MSPEEVDEAEIACVPAEVVDESALLIGGNDRSPRKAAPEAHQPFFLSEPKLVSPILAKFFLRRYRTPDMSEAESSQQAADQHEWRGYERVQYSDVPDYQVSNYTRRSWGVAVGADSDQPGANKPAKSSALSSIMVCATVLSIMAVIVLILGAYNELNERFAPRESSGLAPFGEGRFVERQPDPASVQKPEHNWLVDGQKCRIPLMNAWDKSIAHEVRRKPSLDCAKLLQADGSFKPSLTFVRGNRLHLTEYARALSLAKDDCCYKQISRDNDDRSLIYSDNCAKFDQLEGFRSPFELIQITCPKFNYTNFHSFVEIDAGERTACEQVAAKNLDKDNYYNVIIVGVDTISRLNGYRQLNRTLALLSQHFDTIEFKGYNKVGENTFPNLVPLLTGLTPEQLSITDCWSANYTQQSESGDGFLDNCKYLWNYYRELGYTTYFSEDWPKASTFNYLKDGFKSQPTSFYGRPFTIARDHLLVPRVDMGCASCLLDRPLVEIDLENLRAFVTENKELPYFAFHWINCPQHDDLNGASQVDSILERFFSDIKHLTKDDRTFVVFLSDHGYRWNSFVSTHIGHYESSLPLLTVAAPKRFIENHRSHYENLKSLQNVLLTPFDLFKTMIDIRGLGLRAPAPLGAALDKPSSAPTSAPVKTASEDYAGEGALTTAQVSVVKPLDGINYKQAFSSISMLERHSPSKLDRSCSEAGVPDNYCVCHEFEQVGALSEDVQGAALYLVHVHIYDILAKQQQLCSPLDLDEVITAEVFDLTSMKARRLKRDSAPSAAATTPPPPPATKAKADLSESPLEALGYVNRQSTSLPNREYNLKFQTVPGKALFQEVVRYYGGDLADCKLAVKTLSTELARLDAEGKHRATLAMNKVCRFSVHSRSMSRLNLYKGQSDCVKSNIELKKTCYCRSNVR